MKTFLAFGLAFCLLLTSCSKEVPRRIRNTYFVGKWKFEMVTRDLGLTEMHEYDGAMLQLNKDYTADYIDASGNITMQGTWSISYRRKELIRTREDWDYYHMIVDLADPTGTQHLLINSSKTMLLHQRSVYYKLYLSDSGWEYELMSY